MQGRGFWIVIGVAGALAVAWAVVVVWHWSRGSQGDIGPVGDGLAPIASFLTVVALAIAFKQRHDDAERAHLDRLAWSYPVWFEKAWCSATAHIDNLQGAIDKDQRQPDMPGLHRALVHAAEPERDLRLAATAVLMLEQDPTFAERLRGTYIPLPRWSGTAQITSDERAPYRAHAKNLLAALRQRRTEIDALFEDRGQRLSAKRG